jgi:hypothetical protein
MTSYIDTIAATVDVSSYTKAISVHAWFDPLEATEFSCLLCNRKSLMTMHYISNTKSCEDESVPAFKVTPSVPNCEVYSDYDCKLCNTSAFLKIPLKGLNTCESYPCASLVNHSLLLK